MTELEPIMITARNREQAEYLIRSRAEQRRVAISRVEVADGGGGSWLVTLEVADADKVEAARLGDDTQVLHINFPTAGPASSGDAI
jgi:hypothetical protein